MTGDKIVSGRDVLVTLRFGVPPGQDPALAAAQLQGALHIPLGLVQYIKEANATVVDAIDGPKLHRV